MLSQTSEYALRAMSTLAYAPDQLTPTPVLAEMTKVPFNYLAKVLQSLAQADLIIGRRGVGGGYRLAQPAADISLLTIINAIDPIERIECCPLGLSNHGSNLCPLHQALDQAAKGLIEQFEGTTLKDLISDPNSSKPLCDTETTARLTVSADKS
ncbi:MAG: Rrf2 family nitric oxide-sensitive transcriptional repressor [Phycisphaerales bacterium]|jgi:Rrf2 family nitric oxide-sensitive transcriptional repressor